MPGLYGAAVVAGLVCAVGAIAPPQCRALPVIETVAEGCLPVNRLVGPTALGLGEGGDVLALWSRADPPGIGGRVLPAVGSPGDEFALVPGHMLGAVALLSDGGFVLASMPLGEGTRLLLGAYDLQGMGRGAEVVIPQTGEEKPGVAVVADPDLNRDLVIVVVPVIDSIINATSNESVPRSTIRAYIYPVVPGGGIDRTKARSVIIDATGRSHGRVAAAATHDGFLVAWVRMASQGGGRQGRAASEHLLCRKLGFDGAPKGPVSTVRTALPGSLARAPAVAALADGSYVIVYAALDPAPPAISQDVMPLENVIDVGEESYLNMVQLLEELGELPADEEEGGGLARHDLRISHRRADGKLLSSSTVLLGGRVVGSGSPAVAALPLGGFVVAWDGSTSGKHGRSVFTRMYNATAVPASADLEAVSSTGPDANESGDGHPALAMNSTTGEYTVVWLHSPRADNGALATTLARRFSCDRCAHCAPDPCRMFVSCNPAAADAGCFYADKDNGTPCQGGWCIEGRCILDLCRDKECGCGQCVACNPRTGKCERLQDEESCDDGDARTLGDKCMNGQCVGEDPCANTVCAPPSQCQRVNACDPTTGECAAENVSNGSETACDLPNPEAGPGVCYNGQCLSARNCSGIFCVSNRVCHKAYCDVTLGACNREPYPDGHSYDHCSLCVNGVCHIP